MTELFRGRDLLAAAKRGAPAGPVWARLADLTVPLDAAPDLSDTFPEWVEEAMLTAFFRVEDVNCTNGNEPYSSHWIRRPYLTGVKIEDVPGGPHYRDRDSFAAMIGEAACVRIEEAQAEALE